MMMAYDSSHTPPRRLDQATIERMRAALREFIVGGAVTSNLRDALVEMAAEARDKQILPEHLLIVLKDSWCTLPEVRNMEDATEQVRLLQRVVTMCIKEYYSA